MSRVLSRINRNKNHFLSADWVPDTLETRTQRPGFPTRRSGQVSRPCRGEASGLRGGHSVWVSGTPRPRDDRVGAVCRGLSVRYLFYFSTGERWRRCYEDEKLRESGVQ